jgi:4a-hydroxytetrahydrobiopterin dehydratase
MREFIFTNFLQAFEFMKRCAVFAEEIDHHPDWSNSWNTVRVELTTHSARRLTELDLKLAQQMDLIAQELSALPHSAPLR